MLLFHKAWFPRINRKCSPFHPYSIYLQSNTFAFRLYSILCSKLDAFRVNKLNQCESNFSIILAQNTLNILETFQTEKKHSSSQLERINNQSVSVNIQNEKGKFFETQGSRNIQFVGVNISSDFRCITNPFREILH